MTGTPGMPRFLHRSWGTISLAVVVSGFLAASLPLSRIAGWIPRAVLSVTLVLIVVQLALEIRERLRNAPDTSRSALPDSSTAADGAIDPGAGVAHGDPEPVPSLPVRSVTPGQAVLWLSGLLLAVLLLGTTIGSSLFCLSYMRWHARESWAISSAFALGLGASVQLIFGALLQATLHPGWLWPLVR